MRPVSSWSTVWLLLTAARRRARGRRRRQLQLWQQRSGRKGINLGRLAPVLGFLITLAVQMMFIFGMVMVVQKGQVADLEQGGKLAMSREGIEALKKEGPVQREDTQRITGAKANIATFKLQLLESKTTAEKAAAAAGLKEWSDYLAAEESRAAKSLEYSDWYLKHAAGRYAVEHGITDAAAEVMVRRHFESQGADGFVDAEGPLPFEGGRHFGPRVLAGLFLILLWWFIMTASQGEGMDMDFQRRRHPMWEWLLGHPVRPGAVFFAEMLAPVAANPMYLTAPLFWAVLFGGLHGVPGGLLALVLIGVPVTLALACVGKALEIGAMLRLSMRSRGAVLGLVSWLGYVSMFGALILMPQLSRPGPGLMQVLEPLAGLGSWSWVHWALGLDRWGQPCFVAAVALYGSAAVLLGGGAIVFSAWATGKGLAGGFGSAPAPAGAVLQAGVSSLGGDPLFRKELLWFKRDRGAVIQVILIPLTMAGFQLVNMRGALQHAQNAWYVMGGAAVLFGTYFLFILGPRSLQSEGPALWIAWTWPRGMEELLKAKARLWWMLSSGVVFLVLAVAAAMFPRDWWRVGLVGLGWFFFSHSLARKAVTLVSKPSDSGEADPIPRGRRWAASLGTFTFSIGVLTQQWPLAVVGVVYSWLTAAAMWENFRARLPFLYDPWSEKLPRPPTLMHAMVAVSAMMEVTAVLSGGLNFLAGPDQRETARAIAYAVTAAVTCGIMTRWLARREVAARAVWTWPEVDRASVAWWWKLGAAVAGGAILAAGAWLYLKSLTYFPEPAASLSLAREYLRMHPHQHGWLAFTAVICAPLAEEYLFRGLLYRALDREWRGWRAVWASAGFFAICHPPASWLPVLALGAVNAMLFKRSGSLWPTVVLHLIYNLAVVFLT